MIQFPKNFYGERPRQHRKPRGLRLLTAKVPLHGTNGLS